MKLTKRELVLLVTVVVIGIVWVLWPKIFPEVKAHPPVKTFALWYIDPKNGRDTGSIVFRLDYDTVAPYKKWVPRYFVPIPTPDTIKRVGQKDTIVMKREFFLLSDTSIVIHDFDKRY